MNTRDKVDRAANPDGLFFYREGIFYKLYNQRAMLFIENLKPLKVMVRNVFFYLLIIRLEFA